MTEHDLAPLLEGGTLGSNLICLDRVDSTNNYAKQLAGQGAPHGTVILAGEQTRGRGRLGKSFSSPGGKGLYLSVLLRPDWEPEQALSLTARTAVALCDAVEQIAGERPGIKWTNDLILRQRKLCGILTEMELDAESGRLEYIVVGVGINVSQTGADFGEKLAPIAISLEQALGRSVPRAELAAAVLRRLDRMVREFPDRGADDLERYRADCVTLGRTVRLIRQGESCTAFAESIDEAFALVVRHSDGTRETVTAGDVSVRGLLGYV